MSEEKQNPPQSTNQNSVIKASTPSDSVMELTGGRSPMQLFEELTKSANTGVKTTADAVLFYLKAKELGIGFGNAIPHMHVINGKAGIDIHIVRALLTKPGSGVRWELIKDYEPCYMYIAKDGTKISYKNLPPNVNIVDNKEFAKLKQEGDKIIVTPIPDGKNPGSYVIEDYQTIYKFTRKKKDIDGEWMTTIEFGRFSWNDAITAHLPFDKSGTMNPESNWSKYRAMMVDIRAFTFGARRIASDLLMGCYESSELFDAEKIDYSLNDDGTVTPI